MKTKSLVKKMIYQEAVNYCLKHPEYSIPSSIQVELMDKPDHNIFWTSCSIDGRLVVYHKSEQYFTITHPLFMHNVVLVKSK